jgi:hypothetical protein
MYDMLCPSLRLALTILMNTVLYNIRITSSAMNHIEFAVQNRQP